MNEPRELFGAREDRSDVTETAVMRASAGIGYHGAAIRSPDVPLLLGSLLLLIWGYARLANNSPRRHSRGQPSASHAGKPPL